MKLLSILKWSLLFLLLAVSGLGVSGAWIWSRRHDVVREQLEAAFEQMAPDLRLHADRIQLLSPSVVQADGVTLHERTSDRSVFRCERVRLTLDETELLERQRVLVRSVLFDRPDVLAIRDRNGQWNWQGFRFRQLSDRPALALPDVECRGVRVQVRLDHADGVPSASLLLSSPRLQAIPVSSAEYDVAGDVVLPGAGVMALSGGCDFAGKTWQLAGEMRGVRAEPELADIARSASPELTDQLQSLDALVGRCLPEPNPNAPPVSGGLLIGATATAPRFLGELDVNFEVHSAGAGETPQFQLKVDVRDGRVTSPSTPVELSDVSATFFWNNERVICRLEHAAVDQAAIRGTFSLDRSANAAPPEAELHIDGLLVTAELRPLCPPTVQRLFDHFSPSGRLDLDTTLRQVPDGRWKPLSLSATARESSILFHKFTYPVDGITAEFRQQPVAAEALAETDTLVHVDFSGLAGSQPVTGKGVIRNPGPAAEMLFEIRVADLPVDPQFRAALDESGRKVLDSLNLTGLVDATARCYRPPGRGQKSHMRLNAEVHDARMRFHRFPWTIDDLTGRLEFDSREKRWTFQDLRGTHGSAELSAFGHFRGQPAPGALELQITARNGRLDSDLYNALGASQRELWQLLRPEGTVDLTTEIAWTAVPGQAAIVRLPHVELRDTRIFPRPFPYRLTIESATLSFDPNDPRFAGVQHCEIHSFKADHDGVPVSATGWAELTADDFWQVHFNDLSCGRLAPDDELRAALPSSWRPALSFLSQEGHVSIESSQIDFRGRTTGDAPPTAAWDIRFQLHDCGISAGLDLSAVTGTVLAEGHWDGYELHNRGQIQLRGLEVLEMPISSITGPYTMDNYELLLGNRSVFTERNPLGVAEDSHIQARAYGGALTVDAVVDLGSTQNFRMFANVDNALLERYAALHIPDQPNLRGVVSAWLYLFGEGDDPERVSGSGQLRISPAALYELPVVVQLLSALSKLDFATPNKTAFDYALLTFQVRDRSFWFDPIDLVGDSLVLRGRGRVGFGGDVVLDFFSRPLQPRTPSIPLANLLLSGATQWASVQVRGTTERPQTMVRSAIQLDESLRQFLAAFQPSPQGTIPSLAVPGFLSLPQLPQAMLPRSAPPRGPPSAPR